MLFATSFAAVALSSIWGKTEFEEVIALAVWAGQGDSDGHEDILTPPTTGCFLFERLEDGLHVLVKVSHALSLQVPFCGCTREPTPA